VVERLAGGERKEDLEKKVGCFETKKLLSRKGIKGIPEIISPRVFLLKLLDRTLSQ